MIFTHRHIERDVRLEADLCVIGSGAGGAPVAYEAARAGKRVVILEAGSYWRPRNFTQLEHQMFPRLYQDKAGRTTADKAIAVHQGKGVGGSTLHNINLCRRLPPEVRAEWRDERDCSTLTDELLDPLYEEVERLISVSTTTEEDLCGSSLILKRGCDSLGYRGGYLQHNRVDCRNSGFCEIGCSFDAKQNALKVFITPAVEAGAVVLADTWAVRLEWEGRRVARVIAVCRDPETGEAGPNVVIETRAVCSSASATGTPTLLQRSEVPDPDGLIGSRLHLHPGLGIAGLFGDTLNSWAGIPQSYECTEFLDFSPGSDQRIWIIPAFAHPAGVSAMLSDFGVQHRSFLSRYPQMAALSPMVHDETVGEVRPKGDFGVEMDYWSNAGDREQLRRGIVECSRLLFAAGAETVVIPISRTILLRDPEAIESRLEGLELEKHDMVITAVHPMSTVWMGEDPGCACVDCSGRYHHLDNLFVADTSLYPTSIGVAPQLTTFAMGLHVGRSVLDYLS